MKRNLDLRPWSGGLEINESSEGEAIERTVARYLEEDAAIEDVVPIRYTQRKDGVLPQYDIRTDKWEIAQNAMGIVDKTNKAKREERHAKKDTEKGANDETAQTE